MAALRQPHRVVCRMICRTAKPNFAIGTLARLFELNALGAWDNGGVVSGSPLSLLAHETASTYHTRGWCGCCNVVQTAAKQKGKKAGWHRQWLKRLGNR